MKKRLIITAMTAMVLTTIVIFSGCAGTSADTVIDNETIVQETPQKPVIAPITQAEIIGAQVAWGEGLVAISNAYASGDDYATIAQGVLDTLYGYVDGIVLFKPTLASDVPFRFTEACAASYFIRGMIGGDVGFALKPWTSVHFADDGMFIFNGQTALWMGSVFLMDDNGNVTRVEKSKGYYRDANGDIRLQLHHSSVPFGN